MGNEFAVGVVIIINRHFALDDLDDNRYSGFDFNFLFLQGDDRLHLHVRDDAHLKQHVVDAVIIEGGDDIADKASDRKDVDVDGRAVFCIKDFADDDVKGED